jgi:sulfite exporter TauE/SafE
MSRRVEWKEFYIAVPIALSILAAFLIVSKLGFSIIPTGGQLNPTSAFLIGVAASVSSCLAVVGGLVLSLSAGVAKIGGSVRSVSMFHIGRLAGFLILGALLGLLGQVVSISPVAFLVLTIITSIAMILVATGLLGLGHYVAKVVPSVPISLSRAVVNAGKKGGIAAPILLGFATFFLPCGFTQSVQVAALSTGSVLNAGVILLFFALGTFPMLALMSFSSFRLADKSYAGIFFKTAGLVVVVLAVWNSLAALSAAGFINPLF